MTCARFRGRRPCGRRTTATCASGRRSGSSSPKARSWWSTPAVLPDDFLRTGEAALLHQAAVAGHDTRSRLSGRAGRPARAHAPRRHRDGRGRRLRRRLGADVPERTHRDDASRDRVPRGDPEVSGLEAFRSLLRRSVVDGVAARHDVTPGVRMQQTGGHSPGHAVLRISGADADVVLLGHLAVSPVQLAAETGPQAHIDAPRRTA